MSDPVLVSIPASLAREIDAEALMVRSGQSDEIVSACRDLGARVQGIELNGLPEDVLKLADLPQDLPVTIKLHPREAARVYTNTWMADRFSLSVLMDIDLGLLQGVKTVTSASIPVILNVEEIRDASDLMPTLQYYLHGRHLRVPVEFFHSAFIGCMKGTLVSLLQIYLESPTTHLYVDQSMQVTASERFARAGRFFGNVSLGVHVDTSSAVYVELIDRKKNLFVGGSQCASCEAFDLCEGYLRFVDPGFKCEPFFEVFLEIKAKAQEMAEDLRDADVAQE
ncbi:MAG: hypothetical protein AB1473_12015 [Thermodesulfobacteriota bacterium]